MRFYLKYIALSLVLFLNTSCIEEIDLQTETVFESALVVEATITNEFKQQKVVLSRTYKLGSEAQIIETNAVVKVIGEGISHDFYESEPGVYLSNNVFAAQPDINYRLEIIANNGSNYVSNTTTLTQGTSMDELFFERGFNENNEEGVSVFVNSFDATGSSKYYRYTYEEAYKIIAPKYSSEDLIPDPVPPFFTLIPKPEPQQICYNTVKSNSIIITNTNQFEEDRLTKFRVLFLNRDNAIISHRYSILVNQYVQSFEAHKYYEVLKNSSLDEDLFSQFQSGFFSSNIESLANKNEKVLGYFEVSSVDTKRIYFNYEDLFPNEDLPPYFINCNEVAPPEILPGGLSPLLDALSQGFKYYRMNEDQMPLEGAYDVVAPSCGNCTILGTVDPPNFWEE